MKSKICSYSFFFVFSLFGLFSKTSQSLQAQWTYETGIIHQISKDPLLSFNHYSGFSYSITASYKGSNTQPQPSRELINEAPSILILLAKGRLTNNVHNLWDHRFAGIYINQHLRALSDRFSVGSGISGELQWNEATFFLNDSEYKGRKSGYAQLSVPLKLEYQAFQQVRHIIKGTFQTNLISYQIRPGYSVFDPDKLLNKQPHLLNILKTGKFSSLMQRANWEWNVYLHPNFREGSPYYFRIEQGYLTIDFPRSMSSLHTSISIGITI